MVEIRADEILQRTNDVLPRELSTPVHVVIQEYPRCQRRSRLLCDLNRRSRLEEHQLAADKGATGVFDIELIPSNKLV